MLYQETSRAAWHDFIPETAELDFAIVNTLAAFGDDGLICQEIETIIERSHQSVSGNLRHLVERGIVRHNGQHGLTTSGRRAMKWRVSTDAEIAAFHAALVKEAA